MRPSLSILLLTLLPICAPSALAMVAPVPMVVTIVIEGDNNATRPHWSVVSPVPINCFAAQPAPSDPFDPSSFQVTCRPKAGYQTCSSWQATTTANGQRGGIVGTAWCGDPKIPAAASVAKVVPKEQGQAIGPVVLGPAPFPLNCMADWDPTGSGTYRVVCTFTL